MQPVEKLGSDACWACTFFNSLLQSSTCIAFTILVKLKLGWRLFRRLIKHRFHTWVKLQLCYTGTRTHCIAEMWGSSEMPLSLWKKSALTSSGWSDRYPEVKIKPFRLQAFKTHTAEHTACEGKFERFRLQSYRILLHSRKKKIKMSRVQSLLQFSLQKALDLLKVLLLLTQSLQQNPHGWPLQSGSFDLVLQFVLHVA